MRIQDLGEGRKSEKESFSGKVGIDIIINGSGNWTSRFGKSRQEEKKKERKVELIFPAFQFDDSAYKGRVMEGEKDRSNGTIIK